jgi:hypothetical protein
MTEQRLQSIIDAADPDDGDDAATRRSLVIALSDSGVELAELMDGRIPPLPALWELRAVGREMCRLSPAPRLISFTIKQSPPSEGETYAQRGKGMPVYGYRRGRQRRHSFRFAACTLSTTWRRNPCYGSG